VTDACAICAGLRDRAPEQVLLDDETWQAFNVAGVPGWTMLAPHRHAEGVGALTEDEARSLGPLLRRVGAAVQAATGAQRVHVVYLGDTGLHFHVGFFPRAAGEAGLLDNGPMVAAARELADAEQAAALSEEIRRRLAS
jgi:diadenosine tetraphosphate (Ap4A) HIT family hydrolase